MIEKRTARRATSFRAQERRRSTVLPAALGTLTGIAIVLAASSARRPAAAFDLSNLNPFASAKPLLEGTLRYRVSLSVSPDGDGGLAKLIAEVSRLTAEEARGVNDAFTLAARSRGDVAQIKAALYSEGYYAGEIEIRLGGRLLDNLDPQELQTGADGVIDVSIAVTPGPQFAFGAVEFRTYAHENARPGMLAEDLGMARGEVARSSTIIAASERMVEAWRAAGFPLARLIKRDVIADHAGAIVNVTIDIDPGPPATYGWLAVSGAATLDHETILAQSKLNPGDPYHPASMKRARDRLMKLPSVESVRLVEGTKVDANGGLPVNLEVSERKPRYFGATASLSTTDGAEVETYWGHRNLFGHGEHLRLQAGLSRIGSEDISQLEFGAAATFTQPGFLEADTNLVSEFRLSREHPDAYKSLDASIKVGATRSFSPALSGAIALATRFSSTEDGFGDRDFLLVSLPVEAMYDTRDKAMDATRGVSILASIMPTVETIGGAAFNKAELRAASYRALDERGHSVLAGRVSVGSIAGASLADVPVSTRFFGGGGGSVRGFAYRSLGPTAGGQVVGGLSYVGASAELRLRVTSTFGIVPFVDAASVFDNAWPTLSGDVFVGAGIGLRYYTPLGPLRIDVATPLPGRSGQSAVAVYVGLGQAF